MNIYRLLNIYTHIKNHRVRALAILAMHLLHRRYTCLFLDPALGCNLRCQMCYFSNPEQRKDLHGKFSEEELEAVAAKLFPYLRKLQIGCGAEPTIYRNLDKVVALGRKYGVPYIALTTNGNLLNREKLEQLVDSGLDEITLSVHGTRRHTYERLMEGASFDVFTRLIADLKAVKEAHPEFNIRINYTVNEDNVDDLTHFPDVFGTLPVSTLQLRPIQHIGDSKYCNFSMKHVLESYDTCIAALVDHYRQLGTRVIYPTRENIKSLHEGTGDDTTEKSNNISDMAPYMQLSPWARWKEDFNPHEENFYGYCRRKKRVRLLLRGIFLPNRKSQDYVTKSLNYEVK